MKKEETEKAIEVMVAYINGEAIQFKHKAVNCEWHDAVDPIFDWDTFDYRVKPKVNYRPYANADEAFTEAKKHGFWIIDNFDNEECYHQITSIGNVCHVSGVTTYFIEMLNYKWADDGTPCGIKE